MSTYLRAFVQQMREAAGETTRHGWVITKDVFAEKYREETDSVGTIGPASAPPEIHAQLQRILEGKKVEDGFHSAVFDMYVDNDGPGTTGERMCRGRLVWVGDDEPDEEQVAAPLDDYGRGNWGCVRITYVGHPDWEIG